MNFETNQAPQEQTIPSLYQIIGIPDTATTQEITKMFRRRAVKEHPDKGGDPERFRTLSQAYQILKNPQKRDLYDKYGMEGVKAGGDPAGNNMFGFFQSQHSKGPKKCKPKLVPINITLEEAFSGGVKGVEVTRLRVCQQCDGQGGTNSAECGECMGVGMKEGMVKIGMGMYAKSPMLCPGCQGKGFMFAQNDKCLGCVGKRVVQNTRSFTAQFQPGVPHEYDIVITGQADKFPGFQPGDLYLRVVIEDHQVFSRKGADLYLTRKIPLLHALTGITFHQTLLGEQEILVSSAPGEMICNQQKKIVKRKGMPFFKQPSSRGHLVITFEVQMPQFGQILPKVYFRLAHIINQPYVYKKQVIGEVKYCEQYQQGQDNREREQPQGVQCQSQ